MSKKLTEDAVFAPMTSRPTSFDPLDADQYQNIWAMRMLHLTPIEVSVENRLVSQILSSFSYDAEKSEIVFVVRSDRTFSDGSPIQADDVAFAIARMAYSRPKFPVISHIEGLSDWLKQADALTSYPSGLAVHGNTISISFNQKIENPLFRFSLEIFSIVPRTSVDAATNTLKVAQPPTSGNYVIEQDSGGNLVFHLRTQPINHGISVPKTVTFDLQTTEPDFAHFMNYPSNVVFAGPEFPLRMARIDLEKQGGKVIWAPASYIAILQLNPSVEPFSKKECRREFADAFRDEVARIIGDSTGLEPGLFPKIVTGYLPPSDLMPSPAAAESLRPCQAVLRRKQLPWRTYPKGRNDFFNPAIRRTADAVGIELDERGEMSLGEAKKSGFKGLDTAFYFGQTGFWALDPIGDIRMLFAPNMHQMLEPIWSDVNIVDLLDRLGVEADPSTTERLMKDLNRYVVDQALFNVVGHFRFYFASTGSGTLRDLPLAVQQPYAWQVFNIE